MITPHYFRFDHDGIDTEFYTIEVKDAVTNTSYAGAQVSVGSPSITNDGIHRTLDAATNGLFPPAVPMNTNVVFVVTAGNLTIPRFSSAVVSPVFQFTEVLSPPFNLAIA